MSQTKKSRFFREMNETKDQSDDDFEFMKSYKTKNATKNWSNLEISEDLDEPETVSYYKKSELKLFTDTRDKFPQFLVDPRIQVRMTEKMGKGVFALENIAKNTLIESAPVVLVHKDTFSTLNVHNGSVHKMSEYPFGWGRDGLCAFALGYGGLYNHKVDCNVTWRPNYLYESLQYTTIRDIEAGEELFIRYLPIYKLGDLWFSDEESEKYAKIHEQQLKEDPGTLQTWKMLRSGDRLIKLSIQGI